MNKKYIKHFLGIICKRGIPLGLVGAFVWCLTGEVKALDSWAPTLLVNTESFNTIDDGDGTTDIEIRFGEDVNQRLRWMYAENRFEFSHDVRVAGTLTATGAIAASGSITAEGAISGASLHVSSETTLSGSLSVEGAATFGSTIELNGVAYTFPYSDGASSGKVLATDGAGNLVWATDQNDAGVGITQDSGDNRYVNTNGDTMTGNLVIQGKDLIASGAIITAKATVSGALTVEGVAQFDSTVTITEGALTDSMIVSADIKDNTIAAADIGANAVQASELDVSDVSDDIAADIAEGELADSIVVSADIKDGTIAVADLASADFGDWTCNGTTCTLDTEYVTPNSEDGRYVNTSGDTMTGDLVLQGANMIASGAIITENATISGALSVDGNIVTDSNLTINADNGGVNAVLTFGNDAAAETLTFSDSTNQFEMSDDLKVSGNFESDGNGTFQGTLEINDDNSGDATLTFGNDAGDETIIFNDTTNEFDMSDDLNITGSLDVTSGISGSTLTVDGNVTIRGQTYSFPTSAGTYGQVLVNDGSNNLVWSGANLGLGSGGVVALSPEYPHAVYFNSGSVAASIGQLAYDYDATNNENFYRWVTTKGTLQEYWISARVRIPDNFKQWDSTRPIQFRYRTGTANAADNFMTMRLFDTGGTEIALTSGNDLKNTSWTTATITGPASSGTYSIGQYITVFIKLSATSAGSADAGFINLNFETSAP
ncbi:hypothetical protein KJ652_05575 [Patescibacteria group bacterium]|nr:hypothetical protein [Patescibacteria group bacterium]MBU1124031.1 hypothetical protein [Patescibacteria group bacterium]